MYAALHLIVAALYVAVVPVTAVRAVRGSPLSRRVHGRRLRRSLLGGAVVGLMICAVYAVADAGPLRSASLRVALTSLQPGQVVITAFWATAFILLMGVVDRALWRAVNLIFWLPTIPARVGRRGLFLRLLGASAARTAVVAGLLFPYAVATALTYRPRSSPTTNPGELFGWAYADVRFPATDGCRVCGWWIPGGRVTAADGEPAVAARTVVLCPGLTGGMAAALPLVQGLRADGYNILTFDFRGHGDSGGQLVSYGDLERRDVLGAVRWLRQTHPDATCRIVGLGVTTGGAALLSAATDQSPWGQSIDAVAVYAPYDRLDRLATVYPAVAAMPLPVTWILRHVGLPLAGVQVGADLPAYSPASAAAELWPRPLMVLHGMDDQFVPFAAAQAVYNAATEPKQSLFIGQAGHTDLLDSEVAREAVRRYFGVAGRVI